MTPSPEPHEQTTDVQAVTGATYLHSGKVRDLYRLADGRLLMVASDRVSAFDRVLGTIPDKGEILTRLSVWWCSQLGDLVQHHVLSTDVPASVTGRAVVCQELAMYPVECVARGYLAGEGLREYRRTGAIGGIALEPGLTEGSRLRQPLFTPATKAEAGLHDEYIDLGSVAHDVGPEVAAELQRLTLVVHGRLESLARERDLVLADTKLEFGTPVSPAGEGPSNEVVLADEVGTPDCSRFWPMTGWRPGGTIPSYDKQIVRDWLTTDSGWDPASAAPPPPLPAEIVDRTRARYVEVFERLTGERF